MRGDGRIFKPIRRGKETAYWHIAYYGPRKDGTFGEVRESTETADEKKAGKILKARVGAVSNHRQGIARFVPNQDRVTVNQLLDIMILDCETRGLKSVRTMKAHVAHLREFFGHDRASSVTSDRVRQYIAARKDEKAAKATIDHETEKLGRAFAIAVRDGLLSFKPSIPRLLKPNENARQGFFERADFEAVMAEIKDSDVQDFLRWFYYTGMRPGEIRSLSWSGFDRETWSLRLPAADAKTGFGRVLALTAEWRTIVERRIAARRPGCEAIFHREGRAMGDLSDLWHEACVKAKVEGRRMYDLRRTAVRNLIRAGVPEKVAMSISGHRTRAMLDRYSITSEADLREAAQRVTDYVATLPEKREKAADVTPISGKAGA